MLKDTLYFLLHHRKMLKFYSIPWKANGSLKEMKYIMNAESNSKYTNVPDEPLIRAEIERRHVMRLKYELALHT